MGNLGCDPRIKFPVSTRLYTPTASRHLSRLGYRDGQRRAGASESVDVFAIPIGRVFFRKVVSDSGLISLICYSMEVISWTS
jgi:hypothetical protein